MCAEHAACDHRDASLALINPFPTPGIPHGGPLGRRTRPEAAHAAPEVRW